ncbi:MAG: hypothetical protein HON70_18340 [Lentisphaerae bacterium]|nr:hypothetical protein [Lentisphaerota bacterium]
MSATRVYACSSILVGVGLVSVYCAPVRAAELEYKILLSLSAFTEVGYLRGCTAIARPECPRAVVAEPRYISSAPLFLTVPIGPVEQGPVVMALDSSTTRDGDLDFLYVDRDRDGDLREEKPVIAVSQRGRQRFPMVHAFTYSGSRRSVYYFSIQHYGNGRRYRIRSCSYRRGTLAIGGKKYRVAVADSNGNGLCNDQAASPHRGDRLLVDLNGDGKWKGTEECQDLGASNFVLGDFYSFAVSPDGVKMAVSRCDRPRGRIRFSNPVASILLCSENGVFGFKPEGKDTIEVPTGSYRISSLSLAEQRDAAGNTWSFSAGTHEAKIVPCVVREEQTSLMPLGAPFRVALTASESSGSLSVTAKITGQAGERYSSVVRNGKRGPGPNVVVTDPTGKTLTTLTLDYG